MGHIGPPARNTRVAGPLGPLPGPRRRDLDQIVRRTYGRTHWLTPESSTSKWNQKRFVTIDRAPPDWARHLIPHKAPAIVAAVCGYDYELADAK